MTIHLRWYDYQRAYDASTTSRQRHLRLCDYTGVYATLSKRFVPAGLFQRFHDYVDIDSTLIQRSRAVLSALVWRCFNEVYHYNPSTLIRRYLNRLVQGTASTLIRHSHVLCHDDPSTLRRRCSDLVFNDTESTLLWRFSSVCHDVPSTFMRRFSTFCVIKFNVRW